MRRQVIWLLAAVFGLAGLCTTSVIGLYAHWRDRAAGETARRGLPGSAVNATKHAFAAAETYAMLRSLGLPPGSSAAIVYRLGQFNEYAEFYGRPARKRDPTREIYKDLYNNAAGVLAARSLELEGRTGSAERLALVGELTARGAILPTFMAPAVPDFRDGTRPETSNLRIALATYRADRRTIFQSVLDALDTARARAGHSASPL